MKRKLFNILFLSLFAQHIFAQGNIPSTVSAYVHINDQIPAYGEGATISLAASYFKTQKTTDYGVQTIPFQPAFNYVSNNTIPVSTVNPDDFWSPVFTLPFNFNFFNAQYTKLLVGSNGLMTFDIINNPPGGTCPWSFSGTIPSTTFPVRNAIYGVYQDINFVTVPTPNTSINYYILDTGANAAPNRVFVMNTNEVLNYLDTSGNTGLQSYQVILYETTNVIEINVKRRKPNNSWQGGVGLIGIQNLAGTKAIVPPGYNTGNWSALNGYSCRFTPTGVGPANYVLSWKKNGVLIPDVTDTINVVAVSGDVYTAVVTYSLPDGSTVVVEDDYFVNAGVPLPYLDPNALTDLNGNENNSRYSCSTAPPYQFDLNAITAFMEATVTSSQYSTPTYYTSEQNANDAYQPIAQSALSTYIPVLDADLSADFWVRLEEITGINPPDIRHFKLEANMQPSGTVEYFYDIGDAAYFRTTTAAYMTPTHLTPLTTGGVYSILPISGLEIDSETGYLNLLDAVPGTYTVNYKIVKYRGCAEFNTIPATVKIDLRSILQPVNPVYEGESFTLETTDAGYGVTYLWYLGVPSATNPPISITALPTSTSLTAPILSNSTPPFEYYVVASYDYTLPTEVNSVPTHQTLTVLAKPKAAMNGPSTLCVGASSAIVFSASAGSTIVYNNGGTNITQLIDASNQFTLPIVAGSTNMVFNLISVSFSSPSFIVPINNQLTILVGAPSANVQPITPSVCNGTSTSIAIQGTPNAEIQYSINGVLNATAVVLDINGDGFIQTPNLDSALGNYVFKLETATITGVSPCVQTLLNQQSVVSANATPSVSMVAEFADVCFGTSGNLIFTGTIGDVITYSDGTSNYTFTMLTNPFMVATPTLTQPTNTFSIISAVNNVTTCSNFSLPNTVNINTKPLISITSMPQNATKCNNELVTFSTTATGTDITYQWQKNNVDIAGANLSTYQFAVNYANNNDAFRCVIGSSCPVALTTQPTTAAILTVFPEILFNDLSLQTQTLCESKNLNLSVAATGNNLTYQWKKNGIDIVGQTSPILFFPTLSLNDTSNYTCLVSDICGSKLTTAAQITVDELPRIVSQPIVTNLCSGENLTLNVSATGTNLNYQWKYNGVSISGNPSSQTNQLSILGVDLTKTGIYTCEISGNCLPSITTDGSSIVTVKDIPVVAPLLSTLSKCSGEKFSLSVAATGIGLTYQWQKDGVNLTSNATALTKDLEILISQQADSGSYICLVSNGNCPAVASTATIVTINIAPTIATQPTTNQYCAGEDVHLDIATLGGTNVSYQWNFDGNPIIGETNQNLDILNAVVLNSGKYTCVISSDSCQKITSSVATIVVNPLPVVTINPGSANTICAGSKGEIIFRGTPNSIVVYTLNGGKNQSITLNSSGDYILSTGIIKSDATYQLVSISTNNLPSCTNFYSNIATISVNNIPDSNLDQDGFICVDATSGAVLKTFRLETNLNPIDYDFQWFGPTGIIAGATQSGFDANEVGSFYVIITNKISGCSRKDMAKISQSIPPKSMSAEVVSNYFDENATVFVSVLPIGSDYEYAIDFGPFQNSNVFEGVSMGEHQIRVRDTKACDEATPATIRVVGFPKFFTPNADGINDFWNISALNFQSSAKIYIFDRSGKLVKQISSTGYGWDGNYLGKPALADDYWFTIDYIEKAENKLFKSHFTLKR